MPGVASGCVFAAGLAFEGALGWERPYAHAALRAVVEHEDPTGLQIVLGMFLRAAQECIPGLGLVRTGVLKHSSAIGVALHTPRAMRSDSGLGARACRLLMGARNPGCIFKIIL